MKQIWQRLVLKIDGLTLRERVIMFAMATLAMVMLVNSLLLDAQFAKQKQLSEKIKQEQSQIALLQAEVQQKIQIQAQDPDALSKSRLQTLKQKSQQMRADMRNMQKGLVSPDKMGELLDGILRRNGNLRLLSLKKLPVSSLDNASAAGGKPGAENVGTSQSALKSKVPTLPEMEAVYKHGVEITVQGTYLDMLGYMAELEKMPWQVFWGNTSLNVDEYPKTTLTLTLFTLSLDRKWLNI